MRTLNDERGAIAVLVAVLVVPMMGFAALAIDISSLYQERRELQNGADAGALAVAKDCAETTCSPPVADGYANANAGDGRSDVEDVCGTAPGLAICADPPSVPDGVKGYVRVTTRTHQVGGADTGQINFRFAPVLKLIAAGDLDGQAVRARSVAAYGTPAGAATLPITFSTCEFDEFKAADPELDSGENVFIHLHDTDSETGCPVGPSGYDMPGGFGWLDAEVSADSELGCIAPIDADGWVDNSTGVSGESCVDLTKIQDKTILIPMYDDHNNLTGTNLEYHIVGFAAFHVTGYRFPGQSWAIDDCRPDEPGKSGTCLRGYFTTAVAGGGEFGSGADFGVTIVKLVG